MLDTCTISFLPTLDALEHPSWILNEKQGEKNDCGVYTKNVLRFMAGQYSKFYVEIKLCAVRDFVYFQYSYSVYWYGCSHPLCDESKNICHRSNSAQFLADCIYDVFRHSIVTYDKNLEDRPKDIKELVKLCRKACDKICNEVR